MTRDNNQQSHSWGHERNSGHIQHVDIGSIALGNEYSDRWRSQRMLFVSGPHASGKSSLTKAALKEDFSIFDLGPLIRQIHNQQEPPTKPFLQWLAEREAIHGPDFGSSVLVSAIEPKIRSQSTPTDAVMVGNRSIRGIEYFRRVFRPRDSMIVYLDALPETLYSRYIAREDRTDLGRSEFQVLLDQDMEMGLGSVLDHADYVIQNDDGFDEAKARFKQVVDEWQPGNNQ